jgi:hypothetical protein
MNHLTYRRLTRNVREELQRQNAVHVEELSSPPPIPVVIRCLIGELHLLVPVVPHNCVTAPDLPERMLSLQREAMQTHALLVIAVENGDSAIADALLHEITRTTVLPIPV